MSKVKVLVHTQYFENYTDTDYPFWKAKGSYTFQIEMEADIIFYAGSEDAIFTRLVERHNNTHCKFEYLNYEIQFQEEPGHLATEEEYVAILEEYYKVTC